MDTHKQTQDTPQLKTNNLSKSFAETTANIIFPKKEQAIVLNTINDIAQIEYIKALGKITSTKNITFASRISNNRFCVYFTNKHIVDELVKNYSFISINEHQISFRRLVNPAKRFIISNAHPIIPHEIINEHLLLEGIKTLSQISFLKAGFHDELAHISSFRRQVYIHPDDTANVPGSMIIKYDNTDFRIFLTDDTLTCYVCHQTGHTSPFCKKNKINNHDNPSCTLTPSRGEDSVLPNILSCTQSPIPTCEKTNDTQVNSTNHNSTQDSNPIGEIVNDTQDSNTDPTKTINPDNITNIPNEPIKRPPPSPTNSSAPSATQIHIDQKINVKSDQPKTIRDKLLDSNKLKDKSLDSPKKIKKHSSLENLHTKLNEGLKPVEDLFSNNSEMPISYSQYIYIMENFSNKSINIHALCQEVNVDIHILQKITEQIKPMVTDRYIKTKLSKLINLLFQSLPLL